MHQHSQEFGVGWAQGGSRKNNEFAFLGSTQSALQIEEMEPYLLVRQDSWGERERNLINDS